MPAFGKHQLIRVPQREMNERFDTKNVLQNLSWLSGRLNVKRDEKRVQRFMQLCVLSEPCFLIPATNDNDSAKKRYTTSKEVLDGRLSEKIFFVYGKTTQLDEFCLIIDSCRR